MEDVFNPAGGKGSAKAAAWSMDKIRGDNRLHYHLRPAQIIIWVSVKIPHLWAAVLDSRLGRPNWFHTVFSSCHLRHTQGLKMATKCKLNIWREIWQILFLCSVGRICLFFGGSSTSCQGRCSWGGWVWDVLRSWCLLKQFRLQCSI